MTTKLHVRSGAAAAVGRNLGGGDLAPLVILTTRLEPSRRRFDSFSLSALVSLLSRPRLRSAESGRPDLLDDSLEDREARHIKSHKTESTLIVLQEVYFSRHF